MARKVFVLAATGLAGIAFVLQVVGFALPRWFVMNDGEDFSVRMGLWHAEACSQQECDSTSMDRFLFLNGTILQVWDSSRMREFQVEATLSFVGALLSVGLLTAQTFIVCVVKGNTWNNTNVLSYIGAFASIGSALLGFIAIGRMAIAIREVMAVSPVVRDMIGAPYALIIFGVGSLVSLGVFGMELTLACMLRREAQPRFTNFQNVKLPQQIISKIRNV